MSLNYGKGTPCPVIVRLFIYQLTGLFADSVASQVGHIPFDYKRQTWCKSYDFKWRMFGIDPDKLYDLVEPGEIVARLPARPRLLPALRGTPVIAQGSDKGCETLGVGCLSPDCASMSFGTTARCRSLPGATPGTHSVHACYPASIPGTITRK